ncbi:MAG: hypothetical protein PWP24_1133 [Clostridiales bacterium]|nr:hypothetical protein [Clostridiales bacterium]
MNRLKGFKRIATAIFILCVSFLVVACAKKPDVGVSKEDMVQDEPINTPWASVSPSPSPAIIEEENHEGQARSKLTGLWVEEEVANRRPVALMINNISFASPQSGIGEASIIYEAVVEGGITRMMAIFEEITRDRLGSVRSARHYFVSVADEYDAIYAHFGQTKYATNKIKELKVDNLSGLEAIGATVYYRDASIKAPHNAFASAKGIQAGIEKKGYRTTLREGFNNHFVFFDKDTDLVDGTSASKQVVLGFSGYTTPYFTYDANNKQYYRFQFNKPHIDRVTGEQLCFKNLIIQYVSYWTIDKKNGYQSMDIEDSKGEGLYITNGKAIAITWDKKEATKEMHYYDEEGKLLTINPGKTYIALYPDNRKKELILE